ncbi:MAG: hypothetical protein GY749_10850 [Desulfobacteraceae bacterium]|nr:hypothetical protein [Desulfobacteraceae bacterium]
MFKKNLLIIVVVLAAAADIAGNAYAAVPASEREALIAFYNNTGGENWYYKDGCLGEAGTECSWYGVTCDAEEDHVTKIDSWVNNLSGEMPPEIGNLTNLEWLDLYVNQLTALPAEIGNYPITNWQKFRPA